MLGLIAGKHFTPKTPRRGVSNLLHAASVTSANATRQSLSPPTSHAALGPAELRGSEGVCAASHLLDETSEASVLTQALSTGLPRGTDAALATARFDRH